MSPLFQQPDDDSATVDRRGSEGAPPEGRRRDDVTVHEVARHVHRLPAYIAIGAACASAIGGALAAFVWLGGTYVGPGKATSEFRQTLSTRLDTVVAKQDRMLRRMEDSEASMRLERAQWRYEFCTKVDQQDGRKCYEQFLNETRPSIASPSSSSYRSVAPMILRALPVDFRPLTARISGLGVR